MSEEVEQNEVSKAEANAIDDDFYSINPAVYWFCRFWLQVVFRIFFRWSPLGRKNIPRKGPLIIACNHSSYIDPPILGAFFSKRPIGFLARKTLFNHGFFGWLIRVLGAFPLDRDGDPRSALRAMGRRLKKGLAVVMFPEGTRSRDGKLQKIKRGVGMLSVKNNAMVIPVYLGGAHDCWPRGQKYPSFKKLHVLTAPVITPKDSTGDRKLAKAEEARIHEEVEKALQELQQEYFSMTGKLLPENSENNENQ